MFQEDPFKSSSDDGSDVEKDRHRKLAKRRRLEHDQDRGDAVATFHRPGDLHFRFVAGQDDDERGKGRNLQVAVASGDAWVSRDCHCLRCDLLRVSAKIQQLPRSLPSTGHSTVIVLVDLDNFGFTQFFAPLQPTCKGPSAVTRRRASRNEKSPERELDVDRVSNMFFWCFYSSCFARHYKVDPQVLVDRAGESTSSRALDGAELDLDASKFWVRPPLANSVWGHLKSSGRVYFSQCSAHKQAVDGAIVQVFAAVLRVRPVILVSGDRDLCRAVTELIGKSGSAVADAGVVNVSEIGSDVMKNGSRAFHLISSAAAQLFA